MRRSALRRLATAAAAPAFLPLSVRASDGGFSVTLPAISLNKAIGEVAGTPAEPSPASAGPAATTPEPGSCAAPIQEPGSCAVPSVVGPPAPAGDRAAPDDGGPDEKRLFQAIEVDVLTPRLSGGVTSGTPLAPGLAGPFAVPSADLG